ncbi:hypothetical protein HK101_011438 [Irineochytrium annulatum]|nr:hypothetical protein HK101_011438 [Irineochytrium annulatum]
MEGTGKAVAKGSMEKATGSTEGVAPQVRVSDAGQSVHSDAGSSVVVVVVSGTRGKFLPTWPAAATILTLLGGPPGAYLWFEFGDRRGPKRGFIRQNRILIHLLTALLRVLFLVAFLLAIQSHISSQDSLKIATAALAILVSSFMIASDLLSLALLVCNFRTGIQAPVEGEEVELEDPRGGGVGDRIAGRMREDVRWVVTGAKGPNPWEIRRGTPSPSPSRSPARRSGELRDVESGVGETAAGEEKRRSTASLGVHTESERRGSAASLEVKLDSERRGSAASLGVKEFAEKRKGTASLGVELTTMRKVEVTTASAASVASAKGTLA